MAEQHKTWHAAGGFGRKVIVGCRDCPWREVVQVSGLTDEGALAAVYAARDAHEANPESAVASTEGKGER